MIWRVIFIGARAFCYQRLSTTFFPGDTIAEVTPKLSEITEEALRLPQDEQLKLARTLLERSEASGDSEVSAAWEEEIERRIQMIDTGLAQSRPFADVVRDIDRQLGK